ncbi:methyltransferase domain-containing protein [Ferroplasma sp.]|uniref:class I SAM-dependent methyltransferase n=1 Tax=Ferroplasma sp. TaxID=2591003 RepID=UPI0026140DE5|nr:methyltransferase domain-containing protein [Ferroplasma sp.]
MYYNQLNREQENSRRIYILAKDLSLRIKSICPNAQLGLDIGCQEGQITEKISDNLGISFVGIEPDLNAVLHASTKIKAIQGTANNLPFPNSSVDLVTVISVIEHIPQAISCPVLMRYSEY